LRGNRLGEDNVKTVVIAIIVLAIVLLAISLFLASRPAKEEERKVEIIGLMNEYRIHPDTNVTIEFSVRNSGSEDIKNVSVAAKSLNENVFIRAVGGRSVNNTHYIGYLEVGGERVVSFEITVAKDIYPGKYGVLIEVRDALHNILVSKKIYVVVSD